MNKLCILVCTLVVVVFAVLFGLWYRGGREPSSAYIDIDTGKPALFVAQLFYRGIKVPGVPLVLFKRYYAIVERDASTGVTTSVAYEKEGYNQFFMFYKSGTIAAHGLCMVEKNFDEIIHDVTKLKEGKFFNPSGELVSTVQNGTGVQTLFSSSGQRYWELHLENSKRRKLTIWDKDGTVTLEKDY